MKYAVIFCACTEERWDEFISSVSSVKVLSIIPGIQRAFAIIAGLVITTSGSLIGKFSRTREDTAALLMREKVSSVG